MGGSLALARGFGLGMVMAAAGLGCGGEGDTPSSGSPPAARTASPAAPAPRADQARRAARPAPRKQKGWKSELPADFPRDVPRYPGAKVTKARIDPAGGTSAGFVTGDAPGEVVSFFQESFESEGWSTEIARADQGHAVFAEKEGRNAAVTISAGGGGNTEIELLLLPR